MSSVLLVAVTWFCIGFGVAALIFVVLFDRDKERMDKDLQQLEERCNSLYETNKNLIGFNNQVLHSVKDISENIEYIKDLLRG